MNTTTRRGLLGLFAAAAPAVALAGTSAIARPVATKADRFVLAMETIHPTGRATAQKALAQGMKPEWLYAITMPDRQDEGMSLLFQDDDSNLTTVRSGGN
jgi:hypothetical protein